MWLRGIIWIVSDDIYRAKVFIFLAPAVTASYALLTIDRAILRVVTSNDAALAVIVTPFRIDFSSSDISYVALPRAGILLFLPAFPAPLTLEAIIVAVPVPKVTIYAGIAVVVAVSLSTSHGTLVVVVEVVMLLIYICFSDLRSHKIFLLKVRLKSRCFRFTIIEKYINSIVIGVLCTPTVTTA